jgi:hypothetical protein
MDLSPLHLHLMLNHTPLLGALAAALLLVWGLIRRSPEVVRVGLIATVLVALLTIPVYLTGEPAEHRLRDLVPDIDRDIADDHEERAETAFIAILVTGALAVIALWRGRATGDPGRGWTGLVCAALVICFGLFAWTALIGGQIRHTELRANPPPAAGT